MLGWNPIWESTYEAIQSICGTADSCDIWPVLSMPRPVWYFTAVATFFTKNQFDFYHPIVLIFFCSSLGYALRVIKGSNILIKLVSVFSVIAATHVYDHALDMVMSLSALGLFACQFSYLKDRIWRPLPLAVFSFWMCSAKQTGIAFCAVSWMCFGIVLLVIERRDWRRTCMRFLKIGGFCCGFCILANISPYITSAIHYSHPLYPQFSFDKERFPTVNFTNDFLSLNEDGKVVADSRLAMFLNAFVSPELVRNFYAWKLAKPDFRARGSTWAQGGGANGWDTQLRSDTRYWIMIPIVLMIILGGLAERFISVVMLLCTLVLPTEMIGLPRYVTMIKFSIVFCLPMIWSISEGRSILRFVLWIFLALIGWGQLCEFAQEELRLLDRRLTIYESFNRGLPETLYYGKSRKPHKATASFDLMKRLVPQLSNVSPKVLPDDVYRGEPAEIIRRINTNYSRFPDLSCILPKWYGLERMSPLWRIKETCPKPQGTWAQSLYEFNVFWRGLVADLPRAIWLRITGQIDNHMKPSNECRVVTQIDACAESSDRFLRRWEINLSYIEADDTDAKIVGTKQLRISYPNWMMKDGRQGAFIEGDELSGECELTFSSAGEVLFALKGVRINHKDAPPTLFYADYESFAINGKEMLEKPISVLGTTPHRVRCRVGKGETLKIATRLKPHRYERTVLRNMLLAASNFTFVTEDLVDQVLERPEMQQYLCEMSEEKNESK